MRNALCVFILGLFFFGCYKNAVEGPYCSDCNFKTDKLDLIIKMEGWIVYLEDFKRYGIQVAIFDERSIFIPCEMPEYFQPVELTSVSFCGKLCDYPFRGGASVATSYNCIKLDTIYSKSITSPEITGKWNWIGSYLPGQFIKITPQSTGKEEILEFSPCLTQSRFRNDTLIEFRTFSTGHGTRTNPYYQYIYSYDSIAYYRNGIYMDHDYYKIYNDTLRFCSCYAGFYGGGSYFYTRIKTLR